MCRGIQKNVYGPVMNKVTENRENQGTESNVLQIGTVYIVVIEYLFQQF